MNRTASKSEVFWVGFDDSADKIVAAVMKGGEEGEELFEVRTDERGLGQLIRKLKSYRGQVRCVYEAGPSGFVLQRKLSKEGIRCQVAAPSLTPLQSGNRIKTDRRDARKLVRLYRAGTLTLIRVPSEEDESLRDLVRAREDAVEDLRQAQNRLGKFLLRQGQRYRGKSTWTQAHWRWIAGLELNSAYGQHVLEAYVLAVTDAQERLKRLDRQVDQAATKYETIVSQYAALRGIDRLSALTVHAELGDLKRFPSAPQMMAAVGLVPSERSSGLSQRRGSITKTGNAHVRRVLVEASWHARHRPNVGPTIRRRREDLPAAVISIAKEADARLHRKFTQLVWRNKRSTVAAVAVARELAGFLWAIGQTL